MENKILDSGLFEVRIGSGLSYSNNTLSAVGGGSGPQGATGPIGATGPQGDTGPQGSTGSFGTVVIESFIGIGAGNQTLTLGTPLLSFTPVIFSIDSIGITRFENNFSSVSGTTLTFVLSPGAIGPSDVYVQYAI